MNIRSFTLLTLCLFTTPQYNSILAMKRERSCSPEKKDKKIKLLTDQDRALLEAAIRNAGNIKRLPVGQLNARLFRAIDNNNLNSVSELLEHGAQVTARNSFGFTPLHCAAEKGNVEIVQTLIKYDADVNAVDDSLIGTTNTTPLHKTKNIEVTTILLINGANINARGGVNWQTPLEKFAFEGKIRLIDHALSLQNQFNVEDQFGRISKKNLSLLSTALTSSVHIQNKCRQYKLYNKETSYYSIPALALKLGCYNLFHCLDYTEQDEPFINLAISSLSKNIASFTRECIPKGYLSKLPMQKL